MTDPKQPSTLDLDPRNGRSSDRWGSGEVFSMVAAAVWLGVGAYLLFFMDPEVGATPFMQTVVILSAIVVPIFVILIGMLGLHLGRGLTEELRRLRAEVDTLNTELHKLQQSGTAQGSKTVEKKLEEIAAAQRKTEHAIAMFTSIRSPEPEAPEDKPAMPVTAQGDEQAMLALGTPAEALNDPLSVADFITALNFPENAEDRDGFRALRRALQDRKAGQLIMAAQDVLTLLSQDGIYMDDLRPDRARPEIWRKFAEGERGGTISALGGVRDRSSLALAAGRMRQDPVFRDAVHHFLRKFDQVFSDFAEGASDAEITHLGDTRTARAFMLLGRVTGTFD